MVVGVVVGVVAGAFKFLSKLLMFDVSVGVVDEVEE